MRALLRITPTAGLHPRTDPFSLVAVSGSLRVTIQPDLISTFLPGALSARKLPMMTAEVLLSLRVFVAVEVSEILVLTNAIARETGSRANTSATRQK